MSDLMISNQLVFGTAIRLAADATGEAQPVRSRLGTGKQYGSMFDRTPNRWQAVSEVLTAANEVPEEELRRLLPCVGDARQRAAEGKVGLGYTSLMRGMLRAERAALAGEPWATELMRCWREVLDDFCTQYGSSEPESNRAPG